ncbi:mannitol-1-phosphate 5-dehydrogenase [Herbiconiux sp. L3-i23]|uniref:mannitol-1-phosphate 5-dehydrogenase n=1 Tax=Herbiconiux sp. L3-i23 TaxID=2905871 RepID=UPI002052AB92|nr:mannitol-1-phosphate 5-dehydrogenase [Herbiconiux sp. L3-i23]BDI23855.1 mannitol-1-phosphate 5-dehydrogenase [Herbiconiux sp. L3-i23]
MGKTAVHFGAGNIGRGFVGLILHDAGYEVVFADVNAELIDALAASDSYVVHEVGDSPRDLTVDGYRALNSRADEAAVVAEIAGADVVTTAVGPNILKFIAPVIAAGLRARADGTPVAVMACENAIGATDILRGEIEALLGDDERDEVLARAIFANTAVDRIVPGQAADAGLDVTVEDFFEWVVESTPFGDAVPEIPDATFVPELAPYIERKLFTVNTGHATLAYHGFVHGADRLADALELPEVFEEVKAVLEETKTLLVAKYGFPMEQQEKYLEKNLTRFANPYLSDTPVRVGRAPLRKLSRHERFIGPAAELVERGLPADALVRAVAAALRFDVPEDPESVELQALLAGDAPAQELAVRLTGLDASNPLIAPIATAIGSARAHR